MSLHFLESELIINEDGSIFHLHLKPEQLAERIILVGDPDRVGLVASKFDIVECRVRNREFYSVTGSYYGKRMTVLSTGIGTDNIDIVMNELDALANIDFESRTEKKETKTLSIVRIGTTGGLQEDLPVGTFLISEKSVGLDGLLNFYAGRDKLSDLKFEKAFCEHTGYLEQWAHPYVVSADPELIARIGQQDMLRGVTVTANGFYGPQERELRTKLALPGFSDSLRSFRYGSYRITNYEMESAGVAGLASLMGHKAMTVCLVIVNRYSKAAGTNYKDRMSELITIVLDRL
ncbi:MAG: nucleoside phosphorylase [Bacteroidales bacterium]|nr:nucleoside phosphorylase [Bacteroidales bacterium]